MLKYLLALVAIVLVVVLCFTVDRRSEAQPRYTPVSESVVAVYAPGRVEGASADIELRSRLAGRIVALPVQEGQIVAPGDLLLQIDDRQYAQEVALAAADLALAEAQLQRLVNGARQPERDEAKALCQSKLEEVERARRHLKRSDALQQQKAISQQQADEDGTLVRTLEAQLAAAQAHWELVDAPAREDEIQMAQAKIDAAKARWELAKLQLERTQLRAVAGGQILRINAELGELTSSESAEPVIVMADTNQCRVRAFVEEIDAPRLQVGMLATVSAEGLPGQKFVGRISRLSPQMSRKQVWNDDPTERLDTKIREVWINLDDALDVPLGLRVDVTIDSRSPTTSLKLAAAAR
jgi:HlyD family secretion protein